MNRSKNNLEGLRQFRKAIQTKNTLALESEIERLKIEKPNQKWSVMEICEGAFLKSQNSLSAPWNSHIRQAIDQHNVHIKQNSLRSRQTSPSREFLNGKPLSEKIETSTPKVALEEILKQIGFWEAEAAWYATENRDLKKIIVRLENQLIKAMESLEAIRRSSPCVKLKPVQNALPPLSAQLQDNDLS